MYAERAKLHRTHGPPPAATSAVAQRRQRSPWATSDTFIERYHGELLRDDA